MLSIFGFNSNLSKIIAKPLETGICYKYKGTIMEGKM
jgi:hypothetical protein